MAAKPLLQVVGMKEFRRDLIRLDKEYFVAAYKAAGQAAANPIASAVRSALPHITGTLAGSVRTANIRTGAAVRVGSKAVPYAGPVEFGWPARGRPFIRDGRYIFPTARPMTAAASVRYEQELNRAISAYPWYQAS